MTDDPIDPPERPTSWTVFGIINIVFACVMLLGALVGLAGLAMPKTRPPTGNAEVDEAMKAVLAITESPGMHIWQLIGLPISILIAALLLFAGIGLLRFRPSGRRLSLIYGWSALAWYLVTIAVTWLLLTAPFLDIAATKTGLQHTMLMGMAIGGLVGGAIWMIYPMVLLIFMRRDPHATGTATEAA